MLAGGLGNQLFQYAFGRAMALRTGARLELDAATLFRKDRVYRRHYALDVFQIPKEVVVRRKPQVGWKLKRRWWEWVQRSQPIGNLRILNEPRPLKFQPDLMNWQPTRNVVIHGYWQCPRYFEGIREVLLQDLSFRDPVHPLRTALAEAIDSCNAVAVHVRRVQYARKLEGDYYAVAMDRMRAEQPRCRFFLFGDDLSEWADPLPDDVTRVPPADVPDTEDFRLMTRCRHFIIANSSFSWWAAWLGEREGSAVVTPDSKSLPHPDSFPDRWRIHSLF